MSEARRIGALMTIAAWVGVLLLLTWAASIFLERQHNPNMSPETTLGGEGQVQVLLKRNRSGHYVATGTINRQPVRFLVDTGATYVAVGSKQAKRLGLQAGAAQILQTANGEARGYRTLLATVSLGGIEISAVPAVITPGLGDDVLLGMSLLKRLTLVQRGNTLLLQQE